MDWTTVTMQVTTPLFNGGADPDGKAGFQPSPDAGVRVASIRGAMRFWFRALAGSVTGPDVKRLALMERAVFGGISDQHGEGAAVSSPLILRLADPPEPVRDAGFIDGGRAGLRYLLGLGLMKPKKGGADLLRPYVRPGTEFELKIGFRHAKQTPVEIRTAGETLAFASLWLLCAYGGLGARTRRGLGGLRITGIAGNLPQPWETVNLLTPGLDFYRNLTWPRLLPAGTSSIYQQDLPALARLGGPLFIPLLTALDKWPQQPPFPVIAKNYVPAALSARSFSSWDDTLNYAGRQWRLFRANRPEHDIQARDRGQVRTAEWDNVIHGSQTDFPLGALGLPVGFQDKKSGEKYEVNAAVPNQPKPEPLRRASPVWLRAVGSGQSWGLFSFAFQSQFLPGADRARVYLLPSDELTIGQHHVSELTTQWLNVLRNGGDFASVIRT